jgi:galactitol-specific phosphotransferase system IIB component
MHPQCREEQFFEMEQSAKDVTESNEIPEDLAVEIRRLAHNLSNALEIIVQTSFLLSTTEMKEPASDWLRMLEGGVQKALDINLELRKYIKDHTPR